MAIQPAKNVRCQMKRRTVAAPEYVQKIVTDGNGLKTPIQKLKKSVTDVMVMETAASLSINAIRSGTGVLMDVLRHAASITNVSSMPMPIIRNGAAKLMPIKSMPAYMHRPKAHTVAMAALKLPRRPSHGLERTQSTIMQVTG